MKIIKHLLMAIAFFIIGFVYGTFFNYLLCKENSSILCSSRQGLFVGINVAVIYFVCSLLCRYCIEEKFLKDSAFKSVVISTYIIAFVYVMFSTTLLINSFNQTPITLSNWWIYLFNFILSYGVIVKAVCDGTKLRKQKK